MKWEHEFRNGGSFSDIEKDHCVCYLWPRAIQLSGFPSMFRTGNINHTKLTLELSLFPWWISLQVPFFSTALAE